MPRLGAQRGHRALVIGSGFGGLAAAVRLAARGWSVTVLERHDQPGGRARVFRQDGFVFDAGPTVITALPLFEELWRLCGKKLSDHIDLRPVVPFYRIRFDDGTSVDYSGDAAAMRAQIRSLAPDDVAGYDRFIAMSGKIFDVGFERLAHVPFGSWTTMAKIVPEMVRLESYRTVYGMVSKFVRSDKVRQLLSFHPLLVGGNPFTTTSIYSLIPHLERKWGVHFPMGGTGSLVNGLVDLVRGVGGTIRYAATVDRILIENRRVRGVRLDSGEVVESDIVVSNADSAFTYRRLLAPEHRRKWTDAKLARARYSMSLFVWYFGTSRLYPSVAHHSILLGPRYEELLRDIFERRVLASDFSLYLHRPTATDPSLAPPGCDAFYVLSPVPNLDARIDWVERAEKYRRSIERALEATILPGLSTSVVTSRSMTPEHFRDDLLSERGAAFGLEPVLTQSAYFRPHNASEEVAGLFLVGAGTHPGAGVPGVLSSARVLDTVVPNAA
ncbi:MAG: phytoene desaturase family protein [Polyangiaceae bacterium]|jgi:phytoene desaturase